MKKQNSILLLLALLSANIFGSSVFSKDFSPESNSNETTATNLSITNKSLDEKKAQALIEQADKLYWQEQYRAALDLYKQVAEYFATFDQISHLHWLASVADCYCRLNDYQQAQIIYEQILEERKKHCGTDSVNLAETISDIAACYYYLKKYDKAESYCQKSLTLLEKSDSNDSLLLAKNYLGLGEVLYEQSKYNEAVKKYLAAINYYDKLYSLSRSDIVEPLMVALEGAGACYFHSAQYQLAKPYYERLADLQRTVFGDQDVRYGWSLVTISDIDRNLGQEEISQSLYEKSIWIFRKANKDRIIAEYEKQGKLTPEIAKRIELCTYGTSDQNKAKNGDSILKKSDNSQIPFECLAGDRSLAKPGPWNLATTAEIDPPGWVWIDPTKPLNGVVVCVHGLGLNAKSYNAFANEITKAGYTVIAFHVRGFGSYVSSKAGDKVNFEQCLNDLSTVLKVIDKDNNGLPVFILGESMGGAIALQLTAAHPELVSGLICSVPAGNRYKASSTDIDVALHIVRGINKPFDIGTKIVGQATKEENFRKEWAADPFNRLSLSPKELLQFASFMSRNKAAASKIKNTPVIVFQGVQDKLVKPKGTLEIYNSLASEDKDLVLVGSSEHLIFENTVCPKPVISGVLGWMQAHNQKPPLLSIK